jgi:hypothetical protein
MLYNNVAFNEIYVQPESGIQEKHPHCSPHIDFRHDCWFFSDEYLNSLFSYESSNVFSFIDSDHILWVNIIQF